MSHSMGLATLVLHASLSSGSMPARPHLLTSVFIHSDHVFRGLPFFLVPGILKFGIDWIQDMSHCTWPYHLSHQQRETDVMSLMWSFCCSEAEGVSSVFDATDPTDNGTVIAAELPELVFLWSPCFATMDHSRANAGHIHLEEGGFHIKHGAVDIHFSHRLVIDGPRLTLTPRAYIII